MNIYLVDPKTKEPSVSLSLLAISFTIVTLAIIANILKYTDNISSSMELLMVTTSLYFGRRITYKGQDFGSDKKE